MTPTLLTASVDGANQASYTTASITPSANKLILATVMSTRGTTALAPTLSGCGLTWVLVGSVALGGVTTLLSVYRAMGASPTAGAVTISYSGTTHTGAHWSIVEIDGVDTGGTNGSAAVVQSNSVLVTAAATSQVISVTLSAFAGATNRAFSAWASLVNNAALWTPEAGHTGLSHTNMSSPNSSLMTAWGGTAADPTPSATVTVGTEAAAGFALEIKASAGPTPIAFAGTIPTQTFVIGTPATVDLSGYWSGTETPFTLQSIGRTLPSGVSINDDFGMVWSGSGTPSTFADYQLNGVDDEDDEAPSNEFAIAITAAPVGPYFDLSNAATDKLARLDDEPLPNEPCDIAVYDLTTQELVAVIEVSTDADCLFGNRVAHASLAWETAYRIVGKALNDGSVFIVDAISTVPEP